MAIQQLVGTDDGLDVMDKVNEAFSTLTASAPKTGAYTIIDTDRNISVDASGGAVTISLDLAANLSGLEFTVKKIDVSANAVTIDPNGAELIDGTATRVLSSQWDAATFWCDGTQFLLK